MTICLAFFTFENSLMLQINGMKHLKPVELNFEGFWSWLILIDFNFYLKLF